MDDVVGLVLDNSETEVCTLQAMIGGWRNRDIRRQHAILAQLT